MSDRIRKSGCLCGAVALEISGEPGVMAFCHCESCRGWLGAPVHAASLWPIPNVKVVKGADQLTLYKRTEASHRQFCKQCGSPVLVEHPTLGMIDVPAFRVEGLDFQPVSHVNYSEKVISMKDGVPKFKGFGGPGEELPE